VQELLEKDGAADLQVLAVWMPMLATDARSEWNEGLLDDPRVTHFWDEERVVGRWLARADVGGQGYSGIVWDAYLLFGPEASWKSEPGPVVGSGAPVVAESARLEEQVRSLVSG
jgi:hypothetical protein